MIKRRIPPNFDFDPEQLALAIQSVLGAVPVTIRGRIIIIDATISGAQATALKSAVVAVLSDVQDITV